MADGDDTENTLVGNIPGTDGDDGGDGALIPDSLADLGFPDLGKYADTLVRIAKNPQSFVIGALISALLGWILDITNIVLSGFRLALIGSSVGYSSGETAGIEDLFYIGWNIISSTGEAVGDPILTFIGTMQETAMSLAEGAGIAAFPLAVTLLVVISIATYSAASRVGRATIAAIPIIGPFLEALLPK